MAARVARLGIRISGDRRRRFAKRGTYSNAALRKSMHGLWLRTVIVPSTVAGHQDSDLRVTMVADRPKHVDLQALIKSLLST